MLCGMKAATSNRVVPLHSSPAPLSYTVQIDNVHAHVYRVTLVIAKPRANQTVSLPVWIPGSYLVREFARHLHELRAAQSGRDLRVEQTSKNGWTLHNKSASPLTLSYKVYAFDNSVRTAWLDTGRGFFNGTSLCLRVHGQEGKLHRLHIERPHDLPQWKLATALQPVVLDEVGFGHYVAQDFDELADNPVEMGDFWSGEFSVRGVPHRFVVAGAADTFDGARLLADTQKIVETEMAFWHDAQTSKPARAVPHDRYVFMLNAVADGYGGLEHRNSTALICKRADLPRIGHKTSSDGYITLLGLISHEYFHTWNVKRLRPVEFTCYNYESEQYTPMLWFFEGLTSYYDDLLLRRAGLIDNTQYLKLLNKTINQVLQTPGRLVQSAAQASFDAWVKYYRPDENMVNLTVSYYTKGALIGLCLDLALRRDGSSLDAVMRELWASSRDGHVCGGPIREADVLAALQHCSGRSYETELAQWVHDWGDLPLAQWLPLNGVGWQIEKDATAQALGLRVSEANGKLIIKQVLAGSPASQAGLCAQDEWLGIEVGSGKHHKTWRMESLDDLHLYLAPGKKFTALVARDKQIVKISVQPASTPSSGATVRLSTQDGTLLEAWLVPHTS
jgi:predicted metalloprotease with PDZ domain